MKRQLLLVKGDADLVRKLVSVKGHTRKDGTAVKPHSAMRAVRDFGAKMRETLRDAATQDWHGGRRDVWLPANGGTETPFEMRGRKLLYVWNPAQGKHAYLDVRSDFILDQEEVDALFHGINSIG